MPATVIPFRAAAPSPISVVRVASGNGAVHFASVVHFSAFFAGPEPRSRMVTVCTNRLSEPRLTTKAVSCSFCAAPHIVAMYEPRDVTSNMLADCIA